MTREKVIEGLEYLITAYAFHCDDAECLGEAVKLLKEQETKLLDADEIISGIIYWMECENVSQVWPIEMHHIRNHHLLNGPEWEDDYGDVWKMPEYNKKWRCWSAKPTDEQRKVVKWDAAD